MQTGCQKGSPNKMEGVLKQIAYISAKEWEENICRMNDRKNE